MTVNARYTKCKLSTELVENFTQKLNTLKQFLYV